MAIDAIIRVSFQSNVTSNQGANNALVGHPQDPNGSGPFARVNTGVYTANGKPDADVLAALAALVNVVTPAAARLDFLSVALTSR